MSKKPTVLLLTLILLEALPTIAAQPTGSAETVAEFSVRRLAESPSVTVAMCVDQVPSMKRSFGRAMARRRSRIDAIATVLLKDARFEAATQDGVSSNLVWFYRFADLDTDKPQLGTNPKRYCKAFLKELLASSDELLASQLEEEIVRTKKAIVALEDLSK